MEPKDILASIKAKWLEQVSQQFSNQSILKEDLDDQFAQFFERLEYSIEIQSLNEFDTLLKSWSLSLTESDLENDNHALTSTIKELSLLTYQLIFAQLTEQEAVTLFEKLIPLFMNIYETATNYEIEAKINFYKRKLKAIEDNYEKTERSKSGFITIAAHELKTPLTLIEGYSAMLKGNITDLTLQEKILPLIEGIHRGTSRLKILFDDMVDVSLIENDLLELTHQQVWINRLTEAIGLEFQKVFKERHLSFEFVPFEGSGDTISGDPERLLQVFRNVISNAIKYTPDGGSIRVDGRRLPGFIETTISDTGIGIDLEEQSSIFGKFSQIGNSSLHSSSKAKFKGGGPGLGLYIAKGIIEKHGGTIWVDSSGYDEKNCPGTAVHILIPLPKQKTEVSE